MPVGRYDRIAALAALDAHEGPEPIQVAELGAGHGRTVRALLAGAAEAGVPIRVHAIDTGSCLDDDVLHDERVRSLIVPEDQPLPFRDATLDRVISLNVLEHLPHPAGHLLECHRVLRPGGLLVLAHSDWDTVLFASEDDALTRLLIDRFVNDVPDGVRNADGFMGRKLLGLADASPLEVISVGRGPTSTSASTRTRSPGRWPGVLAATRRHRASPPLPPAGSRAAPAGPAGPVPVHRDRCRAGAAQAGAGGRLSGGGAGLNDEAVNPTWERAWDEALIEPAVLPPPEFRGSLPDGEPRRRPPPRRALVRLAGGRRLHRRGGRRRGQGELLGALAADPALDLHGIDVVDRPPDCRRQVGWSVGAGTSPRSSGMPRTLRG